jgi:TolA-binding protein
MRLTRTVIVFLPVMFLALLPVTSGAENADSAAESTFKAGVDAFQSGNYAEAAKNFETILSQGPTGDALDTILFTLASTYYGKKDLPKAEEFYNRCLKEFPSGKNRLKALIAVSQIQNQTGRKQEAEKTLKLASEGSGDLALQASFARVALLSDAGKHEEAASILRPMVSGGIKDDLTVRAAMLLVESDAKSGNLDEALGLLDRLQSSDNLVDNPLQLDILAVRVGDALLQKQERKKALKLYAIVRPRQAVMELQKNRIAQLDRQIEEARATLQTNPRSFMEVNARVARLQDDKRQLETALAQFEKLPDTEIPVRLRQAKAFDELDQKWEIILIFEKILESTKDPKIREDALFAIGAAFCSLGRSEDAVAALDKYLGEFPNGKSAAQAEYLKGAVALESGDYAKTETIFGTRLSKGDGSALSQDMLFLMANAEFAQGADPRQPNPAKYKEAIEDYRQYLAKYPTGKFAEESVYRQALCHFQLGDYAKALEAFKDYGAKYPKGVFSGDAGYRVALCYMAADKPDEVIKLCEEWVEKHAGDPAHAPVLALEGDALAKKGMTAESADAYRRAVTVADEGDEVLKYALFQANTQYQKTGRWDAVSEMFTRFAEQHPSHPSVVAAQFWISKAKVKEGKPEEAKKYLAEKITASIGDRRKDAVEQLLTLLAQTCAKRPRAAFASASPAASAVADPNASPTPRPSPTPLPPYDAEADLAKYLNEGNAGSSPLGKARLRFARAQLAGFTKHPDRQRELMASIAADFTADQLSALLLAECGDLALASGNNDRAEALYRELMVSFPKSDLLEYAYYGMGAVALNRGKPDEAIRWFDDAVDKAGADAKLADITYGKGRALLAQSKYDEAAKIFEQVAATREWRGEVTAKALLSLGDLEMAKGKPDAALQYYQRVYVAYQRYAASVATAYLKAADCFLKLGKPDDAARNLRDFLAKPRLAALPQAEEIRKKLDSIPSSGTPAATPQATTPPASPAP